MTTPNSDDAGEATILRVPTLAYAEGWFWPPKARKAHWMRGGRSLCGLWTCEPTDVLIDTESTTRLVCEHCKLVRQRTGGPTGPAAA